MQLLRKFGRIIGWHSHLNDDTLPSGKSWIHHSVFSLQLTGLPQQTMQVHWNEHVQSFTWFKSFGFCSWINCEVQFPVITQHLQKIPSWRLKLFCKLERRRNNDLLFRKWYLSESQRHMRNSRSQGRGQVGHALLPSYKKGYKTRIHSSMMRTSHLLTNGGGGLLRGTQHPFQGTPC